jgi:hypothetical protein
VLGWVGDSACFGEEAGAVALGEDGDGGVLAAEVFIQRESF